MATPYKNVAGFSPEDVYDVDVMGDGPDAAINGVGYRRADGVLLRFAALKYGSAAANHGYRLADGRDFSALWAAKGTASYNLPVHNKTYTATQSGINGSAQLRFNMLPDGTFTIVRSIRGVQTTLDSGTWLPAGDSVANYTCYFSMTVTSDAVTGEASNATNTNAPASTPVALSTSRFGGIDSATFTTIGASARQTVDVSCSYYRLGVLVHTVTVHFSASSYS